MKFSDCKVDSWVYDKRDAGNQGRIIKKTKTNVKVEFLNSHPIIEKTYKLTELKFLVLDE